MTFKKIRGIAIPLFFVLPIAGFLASLFNIRSKSSAIVYISFAMIFGYAISFSDMSADSYRYAKAFAKFDNTLDYNTIVQLYRNGELRDLYRLLVFYFVSLFSSNPKVMYAFAGLVYGIFSYLCLLIFVREKGNIWDRYVFILVLVFYSFISLSSINGFRFNTGSLVLFLGMYNYIIQKKTVWFIGIIITPLFHYGFIPVVPLLLLYKYIHPRLYNNNQIKPVLFYVFVVTFFASWFLKTNSINLSFLTQMDVLSGAVGNRLNYVNSDNVTDVVNRRTSTSLFLGVQNYFNIAIKIYVFFSILYLNKLLKKMKGNTKIEYTNLFAFVLFFFSFAFIANSFPSGGRFMSFAFLFLVLFLIKCYNIYRKKDIKKIIFIALPVFSFKILFTNFMIPYLILSPTFWYGNIFWIIIEGLT